VKILHVIHTLNPKMGGPVECVNQLATFFRSVGHTVDVLAAADLPTDAWIAGFPARVIPAGPARWKYAYSPRVARWLAANCQNYDVMVINGLWQAHVQAAWRAAVRARLPYFLYAHGLLDPWNRGAHPFKYVKKFLYWLVAERKSLRRATGVVFTSDEEAHLATQFFPSSNWKAVVVGNGIAAPPPPTSEEIKRLKDRYPRLEGRRTWLFLSRIHSKKGIENLLDAFAKVEFRGPKPMLLMVGTGEAEYVRHLEKKAGELSLNDDVLWAGPLYDRDKWAAFGLSELFILPSHQENFGIAVVEALAMRVPVCITRAVNIWRTISDAGAGLACDDSWRHVRQGLQCFEDMSASQKHAMSDSAHNCFVNYFSIEDAARRLLAQMEAALASAGGKPTGRMESK
jgi:glycosyltransferase involved in cell wall biosynthesis